MPPLLNAKVSFAHIFQTDCESFILVNSEAPLAFIVINKHLFDYCRKTPAIDLAFSFFNKDDSMKIVSIVLDLPNIEKGKNIIVDDAILIFISQSEQMEIVVLLEREVD